MNGRGKEGYKGRKIMLQSCNMKTPNNQTDKTLYSQPHFYCSRLDPLSKVEGFILAEPQKTRSQ